jgi:Cu(I)/Ag(I) efflux system protein CusF
MATNAIAICFNRTREEAVMQRWSTLLSTAALLSIAALLTGIAVSPVAGAQAHDQVEMGQAAAGSTIEAAAMSAGEVMKIDQAAAKIIIKHGRLLNLGMPAMTMAFKVSQPAMIGQVKAGDRIRFLVEKVNGTLTVTKLEPVK